MKRSERVEGVFITELAQRVSFESLDISPFYCCEKLLIFRKDLNLTDKSLFLTLLIP